MEIFWGVEVGQGPDTIEKHWSKVSSNAFLHGSRFTNKPSH